MNRITRLNEQTTNSRVNVIKHKQISGEVTKIHISIVPYNKMKDSQEKNSKHKISYKSV